MAPFNANKTLGVCVNVLRLVKIIFSLVGLAMLAGALYLVNDTRQYLTRAQKVDGLVIDILPVRSSNGTTYKPLVQYTDPQGQARTFEPSGSSNPPSYSEGEPVQVFLDPLGQAPKLDGFMALWGAASIVGGLGVVFTAIGLGLSLAGVLADRRDRRLREQGQVVEATLQSVGQNESVSVNGRHPYVLHCQWLNPQTRELHLFQSEGIWFDPSDHILGDKVKVFIEMGNPRRYLVDLSFLPKVAA